MYTLDELLNKSAPKKSPSATSVEKKTTFNNVDDLLSASKPPVGYVPPTPTVKKQQLPGAEIGPAPSTSILNKPFATSDQVKASGNEVTKRLAFQQPEKIGWDTYFKSGLSFGNTLDPNQDIKFSDLPEPTTTAQKTAYAIGNLFPMIIAQPLIEGAFVAGMSKIPGGANLISKVTEAAKVSPWKVGYTLNITKAFGEGALFGLITNNKKSVAQNALETGGSFAAFSAFVYPVAQFFKPILEKVGSQTITDFPNTSKKALNDALDSINQENVSKTLWFTNPKDNTQLLKVTANGIDVVPNKRGIIPKGTQTTELTSVEIEAFKQNPSLYNKLKDYVSGKTKTGESIPFTDTPVRDITVPTNVSADIGTAPVIVTPKIPIEQIQYKVDQIILAIKANPTDEHLVSTAKALATESGDPAIIKKIDEAIALGEENAKNTEVVSQKIDQILEEGKITPEKQLSEPAFTPYKPARVAPVKDIYSTHAFVSGVYDGKPYTSDSFILEFNSSLDMPNKKAVNVLTGDKAPDKAFVDSKIPTKEELVKAEPTRIQTTSESSYVRLEGDGVQVEVQQKYFDYFNKKYPGSQFFVAGPRKPVVVMKSGEKVGLIMAADPKASLNKPVTTWEKPKAVQPKLSDTKVETQTPAQKEIKRLEKENEKLKETVQKTALEKAKDARTNKILEERVLFNGKVESKEDILKQLIADGYKPEKVETKDFNKIQKLQNQYDDASNVASGLRGTSPRQRLKAELDEAKEKVITTYKLTDGKSSYPLNKLEYDWIISNKKELKQSSEELANLASPQGNKTINKIVQKQAEAKVSDVQEVPASFKISERAKAILTDFGIPISEKTLSSRLLGVYKPLTQKVRVQALYDVTTVTHEAIHAIDDQIKFSEDLIKSTGQGAEIRKRLTDIYEELYPKAQRTHKLEKRIKEGLAVLFENYFYDPASITAKYPDLVNGFIKPEGKYYTPQFTKLLDAMNSLVEDYTKLSPEQRIGSRIRTGKEVVDRQTGFTKKQRVEYELFNRFEPLKRYSEEAGVAGTWDDPYVQAFNIMNKNSVITNWVKNEGRVTFMKDGKKVQMESGHRAILLKDGNWKIEKGSVADYLNLVKGDEEAFRSFLVARRVNEEYNKLNDLTNISDKTPEIRDEINKLTKIIERDDFSLQDASAVVEKYEAKFLAATEIYDGINRSLVDFAEENDMITAEAATTYRLEKGYTSFKRFIDEELQSLGTVKSSSKSKVTSFKERTGSQLDIIDPVYSQITSINEVIGKALENRLWNKVADLANKNPEISQRFEKVSAITSIDAEGNVSFPQEKDPGTIRIFRAGKREFYKIAPEFGAVVKQLRGKEFDLFVQLLRVPASVFTRFTTSANPLFAVGNLAVDQFTATAQTKSGFIPVVDPVKSFVKYFSGDEGMSAYIAMGGIRQSLASFYDLAPEDVAHKLTGGQTKFEKGVDVIDSALGVLEMPSNLSEISTRYSEYDRLVEKGVPMSVAMFQASDVTTPFQLQGNMGGRLGQEYIKAIPYLNAIIQVQYKSYRAGFKDNPKRYWTTTAGVAAIGLTTAILIYSNASEKQKRLMGEQPVRNNSQYIYLPSLDGESLWRLKVPQQMGIWHGMASLYVAQNYKGNEATFNDYVDVVSSAIPDQVQFWSPEKAVLSWIPQAGKPSIETLANFKTFPELGPIVPPYMVDQAPEKQYNAYTSEVAKTVAGILGVSPIKTDFWIKNQFGVVGNLLLGKTPSNPINIQEKDYVMTGRSYNRFYENRAIVEEQYTRIITDDKGENQKYTYDQKYEIKEEKNVYTKVSDLLKNMREMNKTADLPEGIKSSAYEILLKIDSSKNINDVVPDIYRLQDEIMKVKMAEPIPTKPKE